MTASGFTFDKSLKDVLANPVCIRQLLQFYVCRAEVLEEIDFERIEQLGTEFIDPSTQRSYYGDMLWKIGYKDPKREPLYLVLLLELQSTNCRYMALRMNNYMTQFYLRLLKTPAAQESQLLPQVLPVVFYTGWNVWKGPLSVCELIENGALNRCTISNILCWTFPVSLTRRRKIVRFGCWLIVCRSARWTNFGKGGTI